MSVDDKVRNICLDHICGRYQGYQLGIKGKINVNDKVCNVCASDSSGFDLGGGYRVTSTKR